MRMRLENAVDVTDQGFLLSADDLLPVEVLPPVTVLLSVEVLLPVAFLPSVVAWPLPVLLPSALFASLILAPPLFFWLLSGATC